MKINIKSFKKLKDNTYKLQLEDGNEITLLDEVILKYNLLANKFIDSKELDQLLSANNSSLCYNKALKYLGIRIRHKNEVIKYLERHGFNSLVINDCIKRLENQKYLNEESFIKAFINDEINLNNSGPAKIKYKLLKIGANEELIDQYLNQVDDNLWQDKLNRLIDKKIVLYKSYSKNKIKEKILVSCLNEGFKKENIIRILAEKEIKSDLKKLEKEAKRLEQKLKMKYNNSDLKYQIKGRLLNKGYLYEEVEEIIDKL